MEIKIAVALLISVFGIYFIASQGRADSRRKDQALLLGQRSFDRYRIRPLLGSCIVLLLSAASTVYLIYLIFNR